MEFLEKAAVRIRHWMEHNEAHQREYGLFARELEAADAVTCASHIREMAEITKVSNDCLRRALAALESSKG